MVAHLEYILTCDINAHKPPIKQTIDMFSTYSFLRWAYHHRTVLWGVYRHDHAFRKSLLYLALARLHSYQLT